MSDLSLNLTALPSLSDRLPARLKRALSYIRHLWRHVDQNPIRLFRVMAEMAVLRAVYGISPSYYLLGHFHDNRFTWAEKKQFLSERAFERLVWRLNNPDYRKISQNKLAEKALLTSLGLPTPAFLGFYHRKTGRTPNGSHLQTAPDLLCFFTRLLEGAQEVDICFKALEGWNGAGFFALRLSEINGKLVLSKRSATGFKALSVQDLMEQLDSTDGYVIERFIDQHPDYAAFHANSVNSYRFWVRLDPDGTADVPLAFLRIGTGGAIIDNGHAGRIIVPLDAETGTRKIALEPTVERAAVPHHPDSQLPTSGPALALYNDAKTLAIDALRAFPGLNFAGVDVAISTEGPIVLELNPFPGWHGPHWCDQPTTRLFPTPLLKGNNSK